MSVSVNITYFYYIQVPLEPNRTVSVFRERVEKHKDELAELEVLENVQEKERPVSYYCVNN